jgi:hypothetical protein
LRRATACTLVSGSMRPGMHELINPLGKTYWVNVQGPDYDPVIVTDLRGHVVFGTEVLANTLRRSKLLEARSTSLGFAADQSGPHARRLYRDMLPLADELAQKLGLK